MEQKQAISYQLDLELSKDQTEDFLPSHFSAAVSETETRKDLQAKGAGEQQRALATDLLEAICSHENIRRAYKQVRQNKGVAGIDGMPVEEFQGGIPKKETL